MTKRGLVPAPVGIGGYNINKIKVKKTRSDD